MLGVFLLFFLFFFFCCFWPYLFLFFFYSVFFCFFFGGWGFVFCGSSFFFFRRRIALNLGSEDFSRHFLLLPFSSFSIFSLCSVNQFAFCYIPFGLVVAFSCRNGARSGSVRGSCFAPELLSEIVLFFPLRGSSSLSYHFVFSTDYTFLAGQGRRLRLILLLLPCPTVNAFKLYFYYALSE